MAAGRKTGGRRPGSVNKLTLGVRERLAAINCDPVEGLARLAMDKSNDATLRARCYADLLPFVAPRMAAITVEATFPEWQRPPNLIVNFMAPKVPEGGEPDREEL